MYDDEKCNGEEGVKEMKNGDVAMNIETVLGFDVESVSIRQGCKLTIFTGKLFPFSNSKRNNFDIDNSFLFME